MEKSAVLSFLSSYFSVYLVCSIRLPLFTTLLRFIYSFLFLFYTFAFKGMYTLFSRCASLIWSDNVCMHVCVCDYIRRLECDVEIMRFDALISYIYAMLACPFDTCFHRQSFLFFIIYFAFFSFSSIISFIFLFFISPPLAAPAGTMN